MRKIVPFATRKLIVANTKVKVINKSKRLMKNVMTKDESGVAHQPAVIHPIEDQEELLELLHEDPVLGIKVPGTKAPGEEVVPGTKAPGKEAAPRTKEKVPRTNSEAAVPQGKKDATSAAIT